MREAVGDLWTFGDHPDARVITTNGVVTSDGRAIMGVGTARQAADRYPGIAQLLGELITTFGNHPARLVLIEGTWIVSFPVKHHWRDPASPALIAASARELVELADQYNWQQIVLPRPGCGAGQLSWPVVQPIIEPIFDDRFVVLAFK